MKVHALVLACVLTSITTLTAQQPAPQTTAIRTGRLVDPEAGTVSANQVILVQNGRISAADLIAADGNPLESIDALRRVCFVMKDGMVFKRDGIVTPEKFFNPGPVNG